MRFVKVKDEERTGEVAINLDLVREAHFGGGLLHLYFERSSSAQDDIRTSLHLTISATFHRIIGSDWY